VRYARLAAELVEHRRHVVVDVRILIEKRARTDEI
jgi:hypothetical protein